MGGARKRVADAGGGRNEVVDAAAGDEEGVARCCPKQAGRREGVGELSVLGGWEHDWQVRKRIDWEGSRLSGAF